MDADRRDRRPRIDTPSPAGTERVRESGDGAQTYISRTEHILLGLLADPNGIATQVLAELGAAEPARACLVGILDNPGYLAGGAPEASR